jgi:hypothetical protein
MRATYLGLYCVTPFVHHSFATALFHVWLMSCVESLTLAIPFALSHNFQDAERHPVKNGKVCWYKSQVLLAPPPLYVCGCFTICLCLSGLGRVQGTKNQTSAPQL